MEVVLGIFSSISSCSVKYWIESVWIRGGILIEGILFGARSRSVQRLLGPVTLEHECHGTGAQWASMWLCTCLASTGENVLHK